MSSEGYFYVDVWALVAGQTRKNEPLMLSGTGFAQVEAAVGKHLEGKRIDAVFAGNPYFMIQSAQAAMRMLGFDRERQPVMNTALSTLWVDDDHVPSNDELGYRALVETVVLNYGLGRTPFSALRERAPDRTETVTRMFRVNMDEMARQAAVRAIRQQRKKAAILAVTESPLVESCMIGHWERGLLRPGDLVRLYYKVPLVHGRPRVHMHSDALCLDNHNACPWYTDRE